MTSSFLSLNASTVRDIMTRSVETATPDETVLQACDRFRDCGFRHLPIVEDGALVGIVSDRDVLRAAGPSLGFVAFDDTPGPETDRPLREIMSRDMLTADPGMSIEDAADAMLRHEVSALPVLEDGRLIGIVTTDDVLRLAAGQERER
jgi:acetoin utilization protein AcuB